MTDLNKRKDYGIHDFYNSLWKKSPVEVLQKQKLKYDTYTFYENGEAMGNLYVYNTDPLTNLLIFTEIGVTEDCPIAEIEIPR